MPGWQLNGHLKLRKRGHDIGNGCKHGAVGANVAAGAGDRQTLWASNKGVTPRWHRNAKWKNGDHLLANNARCTRGDRCGGGAHQVQSTGVSLQRGGIQLIGGRDHGNQSGIHVICQFRSGNERARSETHKDFRRIVLKRTTQGAKPRRPKEQRTIKIKGRRRNHSQ